MTELFVPKNSNYSLRNKSNFKYFSNKTVLHGIETILSLGQKIWNLLLPDTKNTTSITQFFKKTKVMVYKKRKKAHKCHQISV